MLNPRPTAEQPLPGPFPALCQVGQKIWGFSRAPQSCLPQQGPRAEDGERCLGQPLPRAQRSSQHPAQVPAPALCAFSDLQGLSVSSAPSSRSSGNKSIPKMGFLRRAGPVTPVCTQVLPLGCAGSSVDFRSCFQRITGINSEFVSPNNLQCLLAICCFHRNFWQCMCLLGSSQLFW